ncbi:MAG: cytochrome c maturation protein CcmE [Gammaproteobacteria bacterium AqS3]|nr:cytochrome c maturation protein CcmE [Gammaproteobacteria bacterium AqS3]
MKAQRRNRLLLIFGALALAGLGVTLVLRALEENINLFYAPVQFAAGEVVEGSRVRIGGMVREGSLRRQDENLEVRFVVTDFAADIAVVYTGILPDLFAEGQGMVATGVYAGGLFRAEQILAKHDENYMPPEVAEALQDSGHSGSQP